MKNIGILILCFTFLSSQTIYCQSVMESEKVMSKGLQSAASLELIDVSNTLAVSCWKEFMRTHTKKMKKDRKSKEWFADDVSISAINSSTPIDLYTKIESSGKNTVVTTWVDLGGGYVSSTDYPEAYGGVENLLMDFEHFVATKKVDLLVAEEEKNLKKLEGNLKKLKNQNDSYHKDIENAKAKIEKAEQNIEKNEEEQKLAQASIEEQMQKVEEVKVKLNDMKNKVKKEK